MTISRREALKQIGVAGAGLALSGGVIRGQSGDIVIAGQPVEIAIASLSAVTARITVRPIHAGVLSSIAETGALVQDDIGAPLAQLRTNDFRRSVRFGDVSVSYSPNPPAIHVSTLRGQVQRLTLDPVNSGMSFLLPRGPLLGLGEGGKQFDRKGTTDQMRNGQVTSQIDGYRLSIDGTRAPIQWLVGTDGWAMFIHQPYGRFDFSGAEGKFIPTANTPVAYDIFVVASNDPKEIMREYARITGLPEMPALWTLGYQQSHRTLAGREEILSVAKTFREKKLPCDALIYLGTDFAPSGWNTHNGEFTWHPTNFPDPKAMIDQLHDEHFKVILHIVIEGQRLIGKVDDPCTAAPLPTGRTPDGRWPPDRQVSCYWPAHKPLMDVGVDGWWPDQGDGFDGPSRLNRHRMYWEGSQMYRPHDRPYALHRNASAGVQRFGGFIWSGDVESRWATLKTHIPIALNTGLSGLPFWGTDIGGFYATSEYTAELFVRWFQFAAFCPLFRSHGRNWHLHLPWGWDGGDGGPPETQGFVADPGELHNADVEKICRKYLELRYRLLPYLYTAVRDCHDTGMPIMRALWLHDPSDPAAVSRGDEYMWGSDLLVAPVVEKGAATRRLYLPRGVWIDFWTEDPIAGGRDIDRAVDLAMLPLYVKSGTVIPFGPIKQHTGEATTDPVELVVYAGRDGESSLYEDDGTSFAYRQGAWMRIAMTWRDAARQLTLRLAPGSRMLGPARRVFNVRLAGTTAIKSITFTGQPVSIRL